jgi:N6-L-threonylcarbamoyladenine synthase
MSIGKGGYRKLNQAPKEMFGFKHFDKVLLDNKEGFVFGRRKSGSFDIRTLDSTKLSAGISYKKLTLLECRKTILTERRKALLPMAKARGFRA